MGIWRLSDFEFGVGLPQYVLDVHVKNREGGSFGPTMPILAVIIERTLMTRHERSIRDKAKRSEMHVAKYVFYAHAKFEYRRMNSLKDIRDTSRIFCLRAR